MNRIIPSALLVLIAGCASMPDGPRVAVMPAPGKPFEVFVADDRLCRNFAAQSIGTTPNELANRKLVDTAVAGTAIGAAAGALAGGQHGAATGAAIGMVAGTASGAGQASVSGGEAQRRYDIAYQQCMYAKGNQLPGSAYPYRAMPPPPPASPYPPPPPPR
ncbi:hypothetical protein [Zoogloea sp.]|uniref:hypothetical protein n=1 Tax=Zoogloea sp. TaxID=49181 RepID=UPI0035B4C2AE